MTTYWVMALGAGIGAVAGLVGAGPSILTVLLLQRAIGLGIRSAIATSLVVVALMSLVALVPCARAGAVLWRAALAFGITSMAGAYLGGRLSSLIPAPALRVIFLLAMVLAAGAMLWQHPPPDELGSPLRGRSLVVLGVSGVLIGSLTGLVGLGGGFAVVPLLVVFARVPVRSAVGTSLLVIAMNTMAALVGHLPHPAIEWPIAAPLGLAECVGSLLGVGLAARVSPVALRRAFAGVMLMVAFVLLGSTLLR